MALLHEATIAPRKDELIMPWLRARPSWDGIEDRDPVGTFRLDDPAGEVGIECFLFGSAAGSTLFVPVTYRAAPLSSGEAGLIGTMEHSVLGPRWVYDGCADPVFMATVLTTIRDGGTEATLDLHLADGTVERREPSAQVRGAGASDTPTTDLSEAITQVHTADYTAMLSGSVTLNVARRVGAELPPGAALIGQYAAGTELVLATVS